LFEVYREHRRIMSGINVYWKLRQAGRTRELDEIHARHCRTTARFRHQNSGSAAFLRHIRDFSESVRRRKAPRLRLEPPSSTAESPTSSLVSFHEIRSRLSKEVHVPCLLEWLHDAYPAEGATFLIEKLFELEKKLPDRIRLLPGSKVYRIAGIRIEIPVREWKRI
jgi:hypothetical protein